MLLSRSQNDWEILVAHNTASRDRRARILSDICFRWPLTAALRIIKRRPFGCKFLALALEKKGAPVMESTKYVSTHISSTSFSLDFPIGTKTLFVEHEYQLQNSYEARSGVVVRSIVRPMCTRRMASRQKSCSRGACSRASGQVWVQATTSKGG